MLASAPELQDALRGISIDAQVDRQVSAGLGLVQQLARTGRLRHVLVFALGTNGSFTAGQLHRLLASLGPNRELVLVNTYEARSWEAADNRLIDTAAHRYPNVFLANWFATIHSTAPACSGRTRCTRSHPAPGSTPTRSPPRSETRCPPAWA